MHRFYDHYVISRKDVLSGGPIEILYFDPISPKQNFSANFRRELTKILRQKGLNNGDAHL